MRNKKLDCHTFVVRQPLFLFLIRKECRYVEIIIREVLIKNMIVDFEILMSDNRIMVLYGTLNINIAICKVGLKWQFCRTDDIFCEGGLVN